MPSSSHAADGSRYNNRKGWEQKQQTKTKIEDKNKIHPDYDVHLHTSRVQI